MLAYSVEEMTRLQGKVYRMLYSIREGLFDPNLTGAARIHQDNIDLMGDEPADEVDDYAAESEPEESSSDESDVEALDRELHVELPISDQQDLLEEPSLEKEALPDRLKAECVRHTLSGIIHVKSIDFKLLCGRMHSHNYVDCDMSGKSLSHESVCKQCSDVALRWITYELDWKNRAAISAAQLRNILQSWDCAAWRFQLFFCVKIQDEIPVWI